VRACQDLPGQELVQYQDEADETRDVTSADVNAYLREITGRDITAKDFRTWAGTVLAAIALREFERVDSRAAAQRNIRRAIERVAARLGNTATICRRCYVHPSVLDGYLDGGLAEEIEAEAVAALRDDLAELPPEEAAVLALLATRLREADSRGRAPNDPE
jgi:DNA topoisomerase-1